MAELNLESIAFPTLSDVQVTRLIACTGAVPRRFQDGERLFGAGDPEFKFFIVRSGEVEIIDVSGDKPQRLTVHRPGQFTGDVSHLTGTHAIVNAVARGPSEVFEISRMALNYVL